MLILLPPSEGKAVPARRGRPVRLAELAFPQLGPAREQLLEALVRLSSDPEAFRRLGLGPSLAAEVAANAGLRQTPSSPASAVYTGVLYDALDLAGLDAAARGRAQRSVLVFSGLWGVLRLGDRVPPYRLPIGADLPGFGPLASWWRPQLAAVLDVQLAASARPPLIVDCRSSSYAAAWSPRPDLARHWVAVRILRESAGERTVVSHLAKHTRGLIARHLLASGAKPASAPKLADALADGYAVELTQPPRPGRPWTLDVVLTGD